ncbi:D-serine deaminase, pyridoxal phosphate-dependent [Modicisalibacter muralis]|uniref:D-serine deaminase, pyridoxal phosphate-dependent n=1 Tax=Modicisalibacter muralis TaxID=119000 RepID=A0A1G9NT94_9GAMM|nr:amino acid deaminase [Halomonas muralis]SDL89610.1 D-serine deaminase, pyridoxal phosphate-dependent [Halomonas muralis]
MSESATATAAVREAGQKGTPEAGRSLLSGVSLPAAAIFAPALEHNLAWMQRFAEAHGAHLAPHGKTTMTPELFRRQCEAGAWGITLATAPQCRAAFAHGVERLLLANQLVGEANMVIVAGLIEAGADFYCVVDSEANAQALGRFFAARKLRLKVLIELGVEGGRTGCRNQAQVIALAQLIGAESALQLAGMEGYEGVVHGDDPVTAIRAYAGLLVETAQRLHADGLIEVDEPIVTASGSAWYDLVAEAFDAAQLRERFTPVLRPGCYVVHDHGIYREAQRGVLARRADLHEGLLPALEVFAQVQSLPEPGLAIVALGKRDIGFDQLPEPLRRYREGGDASDTLTVEGWTLTKLMDQHAFIRLPEGADDVQVGDIVAFGASHPCLTFDKWRRVCLVDDGLNVSEVLETAF